MTPRRFPLALFLAAAGCSAPADAPSAADVAGCYVLEWRVDGKVVAGELLPDSVRLDSALIPGTADHRRLGFGGRSVPSDTLGPGDPLPWYRRFYASHWRMGGGDSIHVVFNDNWTQYEAALLVRGGRLQGTAVFRTDERPERFPVLGIRGERFPCPAAP